MKASNVFLFVGENSYLLTREIQRWKQTFREKHGPENLVEFDAKTLLISDILDAVSTMPFIAEKRLVLIQGLPKIERDELESVLSSIHPQTILLIVEPKPDKRLGITKDLEKVADIKTFPFLSRVELLSWVREVVTAHGSTMTDTARSELLDMVGTDQWILESEIKKLCLYVGTKEIAVEDIQTLCVPSGSQLVWKLTDLIGSGKPLEALAFLKSRLERGEEPYGIWIVLLSMLKNVTLVFAAMSEGLRDERSLSSATGLHFLAVRGLMPLARSFQKEDLLSIVSWAASMDIALKSGGIHYSAEHTTEIVALAERAILLCSRER